MTCACGCGEDSRPGREFVHGHNRRIDSYARFMERVEITGSCWLWLGPLSKSGYGRVTIRRRGMRAHRYSYEQHVAPIPSGLTIDHLCRVRRCVNPDHLEAVSNRVNVLRGETLTAHNAQKTHCVRGHPLSGQNLYLAPSGSRRCRACNRAWRPSGGAE